MTGIQFWHGMGFSYEVEPNSGCWLWLGGDVNGYGKVYIEKDAKLAHRVSFEVFEGIIPDNRCVLHRCDTPACVNPKHLFIGTRGDNNRDMYNKGRGYRPVGELAVHAKLTWGEAATIRAMKGRHSQRELGKMFGVGKSTIGCIHREETWRCHEITTL